MGTISAARASRSTSTTGSPRLSSGIELATVPVRPFWKRIPSRYPGTSTSGAIQIRNTPTPTPIVANGCTRVTRRTIGQATTPMIRARVPALSTASVRGPTGSSGPSASHPMNAANGTTYGTHGRRTTRERLTSTRSAKVVETGRGRPSLPPLSYSLLPTP
jgi:hypothetical protein